MHSATVMFAVYFLTLSDVATQSHALQPELHPAPALPSDFSISPSYWNHSSPLVQFHHRHLNRPRQSASTTSASSVPNPAKYWTGWKDNHFVFAFGDSYTSTNFSVLGALPSHANPLGNPTYPGDTSSNGPNYIDFLTNTYNESYIQTYNLGYGGATIDSALTQSVFGPTVLSLRDQVYNEWRPFYIENGNVRWTSNNSLFIIFIGINDAINSFYKHNDTLNWAQIQEYQNLVNQLYSDGARNFLFMNVPPVDRAPNGLEKSQSNRTAEAAYIARFNFRLGALAWNLISRHPDTTVFQFDTNYLFTKVLNNPAQFPETAGYRNTTNYCLAYMEWVLSGYSNGPDLQAELISISGTPTLTFFDPSCGIAVNEYFWLDTLHPTYPMHNFMASQIVKLFEV